MPTVHKCGTLADGRRRKVFFQIPFRRYGKLSLWLPFFLPKMIGQQTNTHSSSTLVRRCFRHKKKTIRLHCACWTWNSMQWAYSHESVPYIITSTATERPFSRWLTVLASFHGIFRSTKLLRSATKISLGCLLSNSFCLSFWFLFCMFSFGRPLCQMSFSVFCFRYLLLFSYNFISLFLSLLCSHSSSDFLSRSLAFALSLSLALSEF